MRSDIPAVALPVVITKHALDRARQRFRPFRRMTDAGLRAFIMKAVTDGAELGEHAIQGQSFWVRHDDLTNTTLVAAVKLQDGARVVTTVLTVRDAVNHGAYRPKEQPWR